VNREEVEALVEALIEEARQRARRRRRRNGAVVILVALVGVALFAVLGRSAQSQPASPADSARLNPAAQAATSKIAFIREPLNIGYAGVLWVMNPDGSGHRRLAPANPGMRWSPDGQKIAFVGSWRIGHGLYVMNADGSGLERLTSPVPGRCDGLAHWLAGPAWSPDGRAIAFTRSICDRRYSEIYVINADGSEQRMLTRNPTGKYDQPTELAWSPLGDKIAFASRRDGKWELFVMNTDGSEQRRLTRNTVRDSNPVWSPDGRRIAFESHWQVWVMNADGSGQRRLTRNGGRNFAPAWSPDGRRIVFERTSRGNIERDALWGSCPSWCETALTFEVHVMKADGSGQRRLTPRGPDLRAGLDDQNRKPSWSPDGRRIAFVSERDGQAEIYVMNADGSGQRNLSRTRGWQERWFAWSPAQK
jgi:TolB protein